VTKGRDSGMPPAEQWEAYFDPGAILESLGCDDVAGDAVEFGCGYGTFTIPAARRIRGTLFALDIDPLMLATTAARAFQIGLKNIEIQERDFVTQGSGRETQSMNLVLLFNILHIEYPLALLREAHRVLRPGGVAALIHWNYDDQTPRGPPLDIRPKPEQCKTWGEQAGLRWVRDAPLDGSAWHWGMILEKP
jgi:SAM-dependent methyltransferase